MMRFSYKLSRSIGLVQYDNIAFLSQEYDSFDKYHRLTIIERESIMIKIRNITNHGDQVYFYPSYRSQYVAL